MLLSLVEGVYFSKSQRLVCWWNCCLSNSSHSFQLNPYHV